MSASEHMQERKPLPRKLMFFDEIKCNIEMRVSRPVSTNQLRKFRQTISAVKSEAMMPRVSEIAKPFTGPLAIKNKIAAVISVVTLASKMELKAFSYAVRKAIFSDLPSAISSRNRS